MYLLSICQYKTFTGRYTPNECHIVLLASACRTGLAGSECIWIGKSESPPYSTLGVGDAFPTCHGRKVNRVQRTVGRATRTTTRWSTANTSCRRWGWRRGHVGFGFVWSRRGVALLKKGFDFPFASLLNEGRQREGTYQSVLGVAILLSFRGTISAAFLNSSPPSLSSSSFSSKEQRVILMTASVVYKHPIEIAAIHTH